jgi:HD-GYP domain-containing protein (c-di-GMP phosphodiesterase class II)
MCQSQIRDALVTVRASYPWRVPSQDGVRLAEVVGVLSLAADVGMAQPLELGLGTCVIATRLCDELGADVDEKRRAFYLALLRHIGCTAGSHEYAALFGDEIEMRSGMTRVELSRGKVMRHMLRTLLADTSPAGKVRALRRLAESAPAMRESSVAICEVASRMAAELGLDAALQRELYEVYERWDGKGFPSGLPAETVGLAPRVVAVAETACLYLRLDGAAAARDIVTARSGRAYDPAVAACFAARAEGLAADIESGDAWEAMLAAEPEPWVWLDGVGVDRALLVVADFTDLKSPWTVGHSRGVAELASSAAHAGGAHDGAFVRRAALVHDLGRVGVSAGIWGKPGPLNTREWEQVRLHPYTSERLLGRSDWLRPAAAVAGAHHERMDGSGYHRGSAASAVPWPARLLAAADTLHAMGEARPHREALSAAGAADALRGEVRAGRLDGDAVEAVLAASGRPHRRPERVAGLTDREVDVLRAVARGLSIKQVAVELTVAPKTVDAHLQHIYAKLDVRTRAAATLFAAQNDLL